MSINTPGAVVWVFRRLLDKFDLVREENLLESYASQIEKQKILLASVD